MWLFLLSLSTAPPPSSTLPVETMQSNPHLLMDSGGAVPYRCQEGGVSETSIPVPVLNWQASQPTPESVYLFSLAAVSVSLYVCLSVVSALCLSRLPLLSLSNAGSLMHSNALFIL